MTNVAVTNGRVLNQVKDGFLRAEQTRELYFVRFSSQTMCRLVAKHND